MNGRSHVLSAVAVWTTTAAVATVAGHPMPTTVAVVGAVVCGGAAIAPDLDCPGSHAARSLGPVTAVTARGVAALSRWVYRCTATRLDRVDTRDGHRGFTHTLPFAGLCGALVAAAAYTPAGVVVAAVVLFVTAAWAARAGLPYQWRRITVRPLGVRLRIEWAPWVAVVATTVLLAFTPDPRGWAWLGIPVAVGAAVHDLGDAPTHHPDADPAAGGIPLLWPFTVRGRRWHRVRPPVAVMFPVGSMIETAAAAGFAVLTVTAGYIGGTW